MSHSKVHHNINLDARILISVPEYEKLLERSEKLSLYEKKYAHQLKDEVKPLSNENKIEESNTIEQVEKDSDKNDQVGEGGSDLIEVPIDPSLEIEQDLPKRYNEPTSAPSSHLVLHKSKQSSQETDQTLINLTPQRFRDRASKLLTALISFPDTITWSDTGFVSINHESLPNSNIYEIFPKLFKYVKNPEKIFGLPEVITEIATLGLGSLINRNYLTGMSRTHKIINHDSLLSETRNLKNWWYLN